MFIHIFCWCRDFSQQKPITLLRDVAAKRTLYAKEHSSDYIYLNYITAQTTQNSQAKQKNLTFKFILLGNFNVLTGFLLIFFIHFIFMSMNLTINKNKINASQIILNIFLDMIRTIY